MADTLWPYGPHLMAYVASRFGLSSPTLRLFLTLYLGRIRSTLRPERMIFYNNKAGVPGVQPAAHMPLVFVQALLSLFCTICCCPQEGGTRQFILSTHHTVADGLGPLS